MNTQDLINNLLKVAQGDREKAASKPTTQVKTTPSYRQPPGKYYVNAPSIMKAVAQAKAPKPTTSFLSGAIEKARETAAGKTEREALQAAKVRGMVAQTQQRTKARETAAGKTEREALQAAKVRGMVAQTQQRTKEIARDRALVQAKKAPNINVLLGSLTQGKYGIPPKTTAAPAIATGQGKWDLSAALSKIPGPPKIPGPESMSMRRALALSRTPKTQIAGK